MPVTKEYLTINDFDGICRTCLSSKNLQIIAGVLNSDLIPIQFVLDKHTQIKMDSTDHLPKQICADCINNLYSAYTFLNNCELVNKALIECSERYISNINTINGDNSESYLPHAIELVRCEIKEEPLEASQSDDPQGDCNINNIHEMRPIKSEKVDTFVPVEVKVEPQAEPYEKIYVKHIDEEQTDQHATEIENRIYSKHNAKEQADHHGTEIENKYNIADMEDIDSNEILPHHTASTSDEFDNVKANNSKLFTCCGKRMTKADLICHLQVHDKDKMCKCDICHRELRSCTIASHMKKHRCKRCKQNFEFISSHKCDKAKRYKCSKCGLTFTKKSLLANHKKSDHKRKRKPVKCNICMRQFQFVTHLKRHIKTHNENKTYKCNSCGKSFRYESILKNHQKIHEVAYECDKCLKIFTDFTSLNQHKLGHSGYVMCDICSFVVKGTALENHKRAHIQLYRCDVCMKDFTSESTLAAHKSSRCLLLKACFCLQCGEEFTSNEFLKQHMMIHETETVTSTHLVRTCSICSKRFTYVEAFQEHLLEHYRRYVALYNVKKHSDS